MFRSLSLFAVVTLAALVTPVRTEKVDMSPEALRKTATHVIIGQVTAVYERTETTGDWKYTKYVAEIRVEACEKGDGIKKGDLVYARYWRRAWIGKGLVPRPRRGTGACRATESHFECTWRATPTMASVRTIRTVG